MNENHAGMSKDEPQGGAEVTCCHGPHRYYYDYAMILTVFLSVCKWSFYTEAVRRRILNIWTGAAVSPTQMQKVKL